MRVHKSRLEREKAAAAERPSHPRTPHPFARTRPGRAVHPPVSAPDLQHTAEPCQRSWRPAAALWIATLQCATLKLAHAHPVIHLGSISLKAGERAQGPCSGGRPGRHEGAQEPAGARARGLDAGALHAATAVCVGSSFTLHSCQTMPADARPRVHLRAHPSVFSCCAGGGARRRRRPRGDGARGRAAPCQAHARCACRRCAARRCLPRHTSSGGQRGRGRRGQGRAAGVRQAHQRVQGAPEQGAGGCWRTCL